MIDGYCHPDFKELENHFQSLIHSGYETGASFAVEKDGEMIVDLWGGFKDKEKTIPWDKDTLCNVFSVTKGIIVPCMMHLVEQGKISLDDKVSKYWPEYGTNGKENTLIKHFLTHRAGMFGFRERLENPRWQDWSSFIKALETQEPFHEPGTSQGYHALTYGFLNGELFRRVTGQTIGSYFKEHIADPFDLNFKIGLDEEDLPNCADTISISDAMGPSKGFQIFISLIPELFLPQPLKNIKRWFRKGDFKVAFDSTAANDDQNYMNSTDWRMAEIPAGNGHGNSNALAKFYGILSNGGSRDGKTIMSRESINQALTPHTSGPDTVLFFGDIKFGLGYLLNTPLSPIGRSESAFGHAGIGGACAYGDIDKKIGFSYINNKIHKGLKLYQSSNELSDILYKLI